jgi:hypothetical protein
VEGVLGDEARPPLGQCESSEQVMDLKAVLIRGSFGVDRAAKLITLPKPVHRSCGGRLRRFGESSVKKSEAIDFESETSGWK